jgi:amino acid transporter
MTNDGAPRLRQAMGLGDLLLFFVVTGFHVRWVAAAAAAGPSTIVLWIVATLTFYVPLVACVLELSSRYPQEGGMYLWTKRAFGPFAAFLTGWTYWTSNAPYFSTLLYFTAGSALFLAGGRLGWLADEPAWYLGFAMAGLILATTLNYVGLDVGKWLHNVGAIGTWVPALVVVVLGLIVWGRSGSATAFDLPSLVPGADLGGAVFLGSIVFTLVGAESASFLGDEVRDARRNIPRALRLAGPVIAGTYIVATVCLLLALPQAEIGALDGILTMIRAVEERLGLAGITPAVAFLITIGGLGMCGAWVATAARIPFVAGVDHYLPAAFGRVHPRFGTPHVALVVQGIAALVFIVLGQAGTSVSGAYAALVSMCLIPTYLPFLFLFAAWARLQREPAPPGTARFPGGVAAVRVLAALGFLTTAASLALAVVPPRSEPNRMLALAKIVGLSALSIGVGVWLYRRGSGLRVRSGPDPQT